jgi:phosphoenolpyruvate synthase/pyruvate phosphate dikinase
VNQLCLNDVQLGALGELALQCEKVYGPRRDIEWAFQDGMLYLVQCRAITTGKEHSEAPQPGPPRRDPAAALQRVELFTGMDRRQSEQIARLLKERRFTKGETVIMEGTGGTAFFLIDSGEARVSSVAAASAAPVGRGKAMRKAMVLVRQWSARRRLSRTVSLSGEDYSPFRSNGPVVSPDVLSHPWLPNDERRDHP